MPKHENYNGVLISTNSQFSGFLKIAGEDSILHLVGKSFWECPETGYLDIHGMLNDGKKVSLIKCVLSGQRQHHLDDRSQFESDFFPTYTVVSDDFIRSDEPVIKAVRYHFKNVNSLLSGHKIFKPLSPTPEETRLILENEDMRGEETAEKYGWKKNHFEPVIGDNPHLLYFSGVLEIIASESMLGKISLTNRTSHGMGSAAGIGFNNEVTVNIEFTEPKTLNATIDTLRSLHSLFELSLGHRQRFQWIELELIRCSKEDERDIPPTAHLYWSLCNKRVDRESDTSLTDVLISPDLHPDEFSKVVTGWMNSVDKMGDPRARFGTSFYGSYSIDRIVGAANMFDLLPDTHVPATQEIDAAVQEAVKQCKKTFTDLPESFARQSILSALGRIGKASLRDKVFYRAEKVIEVAGDIFPELELPCHHAVLARNHYVHGSRGAFEYQKHLTEFIFITDTLEFVFAASDLLDLGWDLKRWMETGSSMTHPFSTYIVNYQHNISSLQALLRK